MSKKYETEDEILSLVEAFEAGAIPRAEWNHAGHLTVALYYCSIHDLATATEKMRRNLLHHLKAIGVDLTKEMPYHETLTAFWMRTVDDFRKSKNGAPLVATANELVAGFDKDYPLCFYSREVLFGDEARARFVEADLPQKESAVSVRL
ncbi:MAG: hypothetical protein M3384_01475 [Acidobacteriota bacterium]|nr:hypothetical protein [Acidobacteriota bacterium]